MLLKKIMFALAVVGSLTGSSLFAQSEQLSSEGLTELGLEEQANQSTMGSVEQGAGHDGIHWDFLTCVCNAFACRQEAQESGFPHYRVRHDHNLCQGHEHLACYGGHH